MDRVTGRLDTEDGSENVCLANNLVITRSHLIVINISLTCRRKIFFIIIVIIIISTRREESKALELDCMAPQACTHSPAI